MAVAVDGTAMHTAFVAMQHIVCFAIRKKIAAAGLLPGNPGLWGNITGKDFEIINTANSRWHRRLPTESSHHFDPDTYPIPEVLNGTYECDIACFTPEWTGPWEVQKYLFSSGDFLQKCLQSCHFLKVRVDPALHDSHENCFGPMNGPTETVARLNRQHYLMCIICQCYIGLNWPWA